MGKIELLDCTLRDGGYINDWYFGYKVIKNIILKLIESRVEYIELGFLRDDANMDMNRTIFSCCEDVLPYIPNSVTNTHFVAMILHNRYNIDCLKNYSGYGVDTIRVTFHENDIREGILFAKKVKEKGYKVSCNPINIMGYSDQKLLELIALVNELKPYAFSIVDTFGSMLKTDLVRIYSIIEHNLQPDIAIGLHLHENLALSFSLAQEFIEIRSVDRDVIIDGSMLGMGRVPGNLCIELIMDYLNRTQKKDYDTNPIYDGIDDYILRIREKQTWGYSTEYALAAKYNLHRNYAEFLIRKGRLRAKQINQILSLIGSEKKCIYDEKYIENIYNECQNHDIDDTQLRDFLSKHWSGKKILILAPGATLQMHREGLCHFCEENKPTIIFANFYLEDFIGETVSCKYVFCSNAMRFEEIKKRNDIMLLLTSNLLDVCKADNYLNYMDLSVTEQGKSDNCVILIMRLLMQIGITECWIAGFDGYRNGEVNYIDECLNSCYTDGKRENKRNTKFIEGIRKYIKIHFLTESVYERIDVS